MHQLILITAMSATTGLFGGKHCGKPHHAKKVSSCYSAKPCGAMTYAPMAVMHQGSTTPTPSYSASPQGGVPAPASSIPTAPAKMAPAPPPAPPVPTPSSPPPAGA